MIHLFTQEEVDEIERHNTRLQEGIQEGVQRRDKFYVALWEKLSTLGRVDDLINTLGNQEKLDALAKEFGLEM